MFSFCLVTGINVCAFKNTTQTGASKHSRLDENKDAVIPAPAPVNEKTGIHLIFLCLLRVLPSSCIVC